MKKLIIHIGYPKTATTSLQLNLFGQLKEDEKIEYLNHVNRKETYLGDFYCKNIIQSILSNDYDKIKLRKELKGLDSIRKDISIISAETISTVFPELSFARLSSDGKRNAKKLKDLLKPYFDTIEVLIGIRSQQTMIRAVYKQWYHLIIGENPKYADLDKWLKANFNYSKSDESVIFNYETLIQEYVNIFGKDNVNILVYEDLISDKPFFYKKISEMLNVNEHYVKGCMEKNIQNKSKVLENGIIQIEKATLGQKITKPFRHFFKKSMNDDLFNKTKLFYRALIPDSIRDKPVGAKIIIRRLTNEEELFIYNRFKKPNLELVQKFGLNLNKMKSYRYI